MQGLNPLSKKNKHKRKQFNEEKRQALLARRQEFVANELPKISYQEEQAEPAKNRFKGLNPTRDLIILPKLNQDLDLTIDEEVEILTMEAKGSVLRLNFVHAPAVVRTR